ncbi:MAG TPA: type I-MYXAN CRISPR-associated protein Cas6/Cmx6 [Burkholderiaceae bacterium]|nr:type I-MYXAN CRISPR-associated protein Cas6/Cmx6 [Burkholderiaceae bacterium]
MTPVGAGRMVDVAFALAGGPVLPDYAAPLHAALLRLLPWLDQEPDAAVHPLRRVTQVDGRICVGAHSRLVMRVPEARIDACAALEGRTLDLGEPLRLGRVQRRPLFAFPTLYSPLVVTGDRAEDAFLATVLRAVDEWDGRCEVIVGRAGTRAVESEALSGFSLMLHGAAPSLSLRAQSVGIGGYRKYGCGVFVAHRSADAVVI